MRPLSWADILVIHSKTALIQRGYRWADCVGYFEAREGWFICRYPSDNLP